MKVSVRFSTPSGYVAHEALARDTQSAHNYTYDSLSYACGSVETSSRHRDKI